MKKAALFLVAGLAAISLPSCHDSNSDYAKYAEFVTVHTSTFSGDYYFEIDNGKTIYPGDKSRIGTYEATEGKRAYVAFDLLPKLEGYDYNAKIYSIGNLFTGKARTVSTQDELSDIKDDPISIDGARLAKKHFTLGVIYPVNDNSKHEFELIINDVNPTTTNEGYIDVELRHNAGGELMGGANKYFISFDLEQIKHRLEGAKGVTLRVKSGSEPKRFKIDWVKE